MNAAQQGERIKELDQRLRESKELIVALITKYGDIEVDGEGVQTFSLFLDDATIARVAHDDIMSAAVDERRHGIVYKVVR